MIMLVVVMVILDDGEKRGDQKGARREDDKE
jgi:hypothetical protein